MKTISVVLMVRREGLRLGATLRNLDRAVKMAESAGHLIEVVVSLDRPDPLTRAMVASWCREGDMILESEFGDLDAARRQCLDRVGGAYAAILCGGDLLPRNWLCRAAASAGCDERDIVWHPVASVMVGREVHLVPHLGKGVGVPTLGSRHGILRESPCFARLEVMNRFYRRIPDAELERTEIADHSEPFPNVLHKVIDGICCVSVEY